MRPFPLVVLFLLCVPAFGAKKDDAYAKAAENAWAALNLRSKSGPPFRLTVQVRLDPGTENEKVGEYTLTWLSNDKWQRAIHFRAYEENQVVSGTKSWSSRTLDFRPLRVFQALYLLESNLSDTGHKFKVTATKTTKIGGKPNSCFFMDYDVGLRDVCFDASSGMYSRIQSGPGILFYSDFAPFANKQFPRHLRLEDGVNTLVDAKVTELRSLEPNEAITNTAFGSQPQDWCEQPTPATKTSRGFPDVEKLAFKYLKSGTRGEMTLSAVISPTGVVDDVRVLQTAGKEIDSAIAESVRGWRFQPAMCGPTAVPTEVLLTFPVVHPSWPDADCFGIGCSYRSPRHTPVYVVATGTVLYTP